MNGISSGLPSDIRDLSGWFVRLPDGVESYMIAPDGTRLVRGVMALISADGKPGPVTNIGILPHWSLVVPKSDDTDDMAIAMLLCVIEDEDPEENFIRLAQCRTLGCTCRAYVRMIYSMVFSAGYALVDHHPCRWPEPIDLDEVLAN